MTSRDFVYSDREKEEEKFTSHYWSDKSLYALSTYPVTVVKKSVEDGGGDGGRVTELQLQNSAAGGRLRWQN